MKCPKCRSDNPAGTKFCSECGIRLDKTCPQCGRSNPADAKFCEQCAAPLARRCPNCGAEVGQEARFCSQCAHDLAEAKAPAPVDYSSPRTYTPKFLADKIATSRSSLEGERKLVTVLFADVANYTAISEKLDPEEVHQIMDGCFKILLDEVHRYEGTVDKFTGDGMMALFGAPVAHEDHAQRAGYAALGIQKALEAYGNKVRRESKVDFKMRIGLNSGHVIVGAIGNDLRMDYTAVGDTVNLASRMQTAAGPGAILVSRETHRLARDFFTFKPLGALSVKGKAESVEAFELVGIGEAATRIEAAALKGLTKFVGREKEMATLKEAWDKAKAGSGQVVGIVGEAGVGKSRLLLELRRSLGSQDYTYLEGHCLHYGGAMAYLPILDILRSYFHIQEGEKEFLIRKRLEEKTTSLDHKLKPVLPPLQELLSLKVDDEAYLKLEPQKKRERTFEAIRDLLIRESQRNPVVLAIEDLHWMDKTSEEFLNYFIGFLANASILIILLYRPEYTHQWGSRSCYSQIRVDQLPLATSAELVSSILEEGDVAADLRELILSRAAGNPLFMEEFTHTLLENGSIGKKDHQYVLTRKASEIQVPDTIQGIIAARMDRLDENLKRTMQVASVIGKDFAYRILLTITGMKEELKSYLVNLQGLEFIYEKSLFPELEYVFKHALTQEVAYNSLLLKRRKEIHERIGKAIEELYPNRLAEFYEMLAYHYLSAENWEKAYRYLKLSGDKASASYSHSEALRNYKEASRTLRRLPDTLENRRQALDVRLLMTSSMIFLGFPEESMSILEEGLALALELRDETSQERLYTVMVVQQYSSGDFASAMRLAEETFRKVEAIENPRLIGLVALYLCILSVISGEPYKAHQLAPRALAVLDRAKEDTETAKKGGTVSAELSSFYGLAEGLLGNFTEGELLCKKGLTVAASASSLVSLHIVETAYGLLLLLKGECEKSIEHFHQAVKHIEELQYATLLGADLAFLALGYTHLGKIDVARTYMERALQLQREKGLPGYDHLVHWSHGQLELLAGNLAEARAVLERALDLARARCLVGYEGAVLLFLGQAIGKADLSQSTYAEELISRGIEMVEQGGMRTFSAWGAVNLGELYADTDQRDKALASLKKAEELFRETGMTGYWPARAELLLEKLQG